MPTRPTRGSVSYRSTSPPPSTTADSWAGSPPFSSKQTGTGVFVVCGSNTALGGIYDYWGCPIEVFDDVVHAVRTLTGADVTTYPTEGADHGQTRS